MRGRAGLRGGVSAPLPADRPTFTSGSGFQELRAGPARPPSGISSSGGNLMSAVAGKFCSPWPSSEAFGRCSVAIRCRRRWSEWPSSPRWQFLVLPRGWFRGWQFQQALSWEGTRILPFFHLAMGLLAGIGGGDLLLRAAPRWKPAITAIPLTALGFTLLCIAVAMGAFGTDTLVKTGQVPQTVRHSVGIRETLGAPVRVPHRHHGSSRVGMSSSRCSKSLLSARGGPRGAPPPPGCG